MTESEIMKALECCSTGLAKDCAICPHESNCLKVSLEGLALDLINRKNAENEDLQKQISIFKKLLDKAEAKIHMYKHYDEERDIRLHSRLTETARAEAIKEFAERVKTEFEDSKYKVNDTFYARTCNTVVDSCIEVIDQIAKEMGVEL